MVQNAVNCRKVRRIPATIAWAWMLIATASAGSVRAQESEVVDRIVAVVNADIVTLYELSRTFKPISKP